MFLNTPKLLSFAVSYFRSSRFSLRLLAAVLLPCAIIALASFAFRSHAGDVDPDFNANIETAVYRFKQVSRLVEMPDGKIVAFGVFNQYNGQPVGGMVRLDADGALDTTFNNQLMQSPAFPRKAIPFGNGKLLIGGYFSLYNEPGAYSRLIAIDASGNVDTTFNPAVSGEIVGFEFDQSGRIMVFGILSYTLGGTSFNKKIVRLMPDGSIDATFNSQPETGVEFAAVQGNKVVYIGFDTPPAQQYVINRLNVDGTPDPTFTRSPIESFGVRGMISQPDNKVVILNDKKVFRMEENGNLDPSFTIPPQFPGGLYSSKDLTLHSDGRITVTHGTPTPHGTRALRLLSNGTQDPTFTPFVHQTNSSPNASVVLANGGMIFGDDAQNTYINNFQKITAAGVLDSTFNPGGVGFHSVSPGKIRAIKMLPDAKIMIGGDFDRVNGLSRESIARLNTDGSVDAAFQVNKIPVGNYFVTIGDVYNIETQADGKLLVSGNISYFVNGINRYAVVRLLADGAIDPAFVPSLNINDLFGPNEMSTNRPVQTAEGKVLVGSTRASNLDAINPPLLLGEDGVRDTSFNPPMFASMSLACVYDLAVQPDGKIIIAGRTAESGGSLAKGLVARLNADGTTDNTFQVYDAANTTIYAIKLLSSGQILAVVRGAPSKVLRFNSNGTLDGTFQTGVGANGKINAMALMADGRIVVGGEFTEYSGESRRNLVMLSSSGAVEPAIAEPNREVLCIAVDSQGRILIGGQFTLISSPSQQRGVTYIARFKPDAETLSGAPFDFDGDRKTDIAVYRPSNNVWYELNSQIGFRAYQFGLPNDVLTPADYTGDGKTDVAVWRPSSGTWFVLRSENNTFYGAAFGSAGDVPVPADYDGDDKADLAVMRPGASQSYWYLQRSATGFAVVPFGLEGDVPTMGDYDGDGKSDVAVYRPTIGAWFRLNSGSGSFLGIGFGQSGDQVVPGDYTGDGKTDIAVYRTSTGIWYFLRSEDNSFYGAAFGTNGDLPSPGDYDGDGRTDMAVWRPGANPKMQSVFYMQRSISGFTAIPWGLGDDKPVPNAYVY